MDEFIKDSKQSLSGLDAAKHIHVVLGNESCDLDSVVCAVVYAYYLKKVNSTDVVIPVVDCTSAELKLRREVISLFDYLGLAVDALVYQDDIDLLQLQSESRLKLTVVDHNSLSMKWKPLQAAVVEIIDHHKDSSEPASSVTKTIESVGSCATLVSEKILSADTGLVNEELATLLLSTILLDTVNLDAEAGRTTDKDREMSDLLSQIAGQEVGAKLFELLRKVKFDVSSLSAAQVLVKDYKPVGLCSTSSARVGMSSIVCGLDDFLSREDAKDAINDFMESKDINCVVVTAIYFPSDDSKPARQLGVFSNGGDVRDEVVACLQSDDLLRLTPFSPRQHISNMICFDQGNRAASRKILLPLLACSLSVGPSAMANSPATIESSSCDVRSALLSHSAASQTTPAVLQTVTNDNTRPVSPIEEYTADAENTEERDFKAVGVEGAPASVDLRAIEKYRRVVSHGGYERGTKHAIIVLSACFLPPKSIKNYNYVMEQLFLYVIATVQHLAVDSYCIVLFNTSANLNNTPGIAWLRKYYSGVDRQLRKNLQNLYIYNPTLRLKVLLQLARPFISAKFWRKVSYVRTLEELKNAIPLEDVAVPQEILQADANAVVAAADLPGAHAGSSGPSTENMAACASQCLDLNEQA